MTDANFPAFLVGRRSLIQQGGTQKNGNDQYVGFYVSVDFDAGQQVCCYVNSRQEIMQGAYSFGEGGSFTQILLKLKRAE